MIDQLRTTLAHHADLVVPDPDPYGRLLVRRRRRRRNHTLALIALTVAVALPLGLVALREWGAGRGARLADEPALTQALLDSPTRGSLAGDAAYLAGARQALAATWDSGPDGRSVPGRHVAPAVLRLLFAGDLPGGPRLVVATVSGDRMVVSFTAAAGSAPADLREYGNTRLEPVIRLFVATGPARGGYVALLLAPAGSQLLLSTHPRYLADGTVWRDFAPLPDEYLVSTDTGLPTEARVQVNYRGAVLFSGRPNTVDRPVAMGTVDPAPLYGRGAPEPAAAQQAAQSLATLSGLDQQHAQFVVLWSARIATPGLPDSPEAIVVTVFARTPDGGGPFTTMAFDPITMEARTHLTGTGVLGDPATSLIAMRLPWYTPGGPPDTLQIVGPPTAVRAEVVRAGTVIATTPLQLGVGTVHLAVPLVATVRALDAAGAVVAERVFTDNVSGDGNQIEPEYHGW